MNFSQAWDAGFKTLLIYVGTVFFWLIFVEAHFADLGTSVLVMNIVAIALGISFFLYLRQVCRAERAAAEDDVAALIAEDA